MTKFTLWTSIQEQKRYKYFELGCHLIFPKTTLGDKLEESNKKQPGNMPLVSAWTQTSILEVCPELCCSDKPLKSHNPLLTPAWLHSQNPKSECIQAKPASLAGQQYNLGLACLVHSDSHCLCLRSETRKINGRFELPKEIASEASSGYVYRL